MTGPGQRGDADAGTPVEAHTPADAAAPQAAGSGAQPTSGAKPTTRRVHRFLVPGLLVLATVIGIGGTFAIWVNRQALNTSNWSSTSGKSFRTSRSRPRSAPIWCMSCSRRWTSRPSCRRCCQSSCSHCWPGGGGLAAAVRAARPQVAGGAGGAGRVGPGQHRGAQGVVAGAGWWRTGRLDQVGRREPEPARARQPTC